MITAVANDYAFKDIFARQVQGIGSRGDILIGLSTSGKSENIIRAVETARENHIETIALTGEPGGELSKLSDLVIHAPSSRTPRIQELRAFILHFWAEMLENALRDGKDSS